MQANLIRLSDLAGEIRRQLKPLGNQAQVAREAQTIQATARDARARLLADDVAALRAALADFGRTEHERGAERMVLQAELDEKSRRAADLEASVSTEEGAAARTPASALEAAQEKLRGLYTLANQRLALLGAANEAPAAEVTVSERRIEDAKAELARLQRAVGDAVRELDAARAALAADRAELDVVDQQIAAQSAAVSRYDLEISQLSGRVEVATSRLASVRGEILRQQNAVDAARERRDAARARLAEVEAEAAPAAAEGLPAAAEQARAAAERLAAAVDELRDALHTAERERESLSARTAALSLALDAEDGSSPLAASGIEGVRGLVADAITVDPGWEAAVAAALGTLADAALAEDEDAAVAALAHAERGDLGRAEIVLADALASASAPPVLGRTAESVVTAPDGVRALLRDVVLAEDAAEARVLWPAARAAAVAVVTRAGEVFAPSLLRGGTGRAQSRIELGAQRDAAVARVATVTAAVEDTRARLADARADADAAKQAATAAHAAVREAESRAAAS